MVTGLSDVSVLSRMTDLRFVFLQALAQVTQLPSFARSTALRRVHLETMKGLRDLTPIAEAPALDSLLVIDCNRFRLEHFRAVRRSPCAQVSTDRHRQSEAQRGEGGPARRSGCRSRVLARP